MAQAQFAASAQDAQPPNIWIVGRDERANAELRMRLLEGADPAFFRSAGMRTTNSFVQVFAHAIDEKADIVILRLDEFDLKEPWLESRINECLALVNNLESMRVDGTCVILNLTTDDYTPALAPLLDEVRNSFTLEKSPDFIRGLIEATWKSFNVQKKESTRNLFWIGDWTFSLENRVLTHRDQQRKARLSRQEHQIIVDALRKFFPEIPESIFGRPDRIDNAAYRIRQKLGQDFPIQSDNAGGYDIKAMRVPKHIERQITLRA